MCVTSMVMDHFTEKWRPMVPQPWETTGWPPAIGTPVLPAISPEEIAEFRKLLERAREYDKRMNQPDCEIADKRTLLKQLAAALGVDVSFVDEPPPVDAVDPQVGTSNA